jgi:hypothetical protein
MSRIPESTAAHSDVRTLGRRGRSVFDVESQHAEVPAREREMNRIDSVDQSVDGRMEEDRESPFKACHCWGAGHGHDAETC